MTIFAQANAVMAAMTLDQAIAVMATMPPDKAQDLAALIPTERAVALMGVMAPVQAIAVMCAMQPDKLSAVAATMTLDQAEAVVASMPDVPAARAIRRQLRIDAIRSLSAPLPAKRSVAEVAATDPRRGPKYRPQGPQGGAHRVRTNYSHAKNREGIARVLEEVDGAVFDPAITEAALEARAGGIADGRLTSFDRSHDLTDLARAIAGLAEAVAKHRGHWQRATEPALRAQRSVRKALPARVRALFSPQHAIHGLAQLAISRWSPAMRNIIARLPALEQQAAVDAANATLRAHLILLGRLHMLAADDREEYARWDYGFGALDLAIVENAMLIGEANKLASRMIDDGTAIGALSRSIRNVATRAWAAVLTSLEDTASDRFEVMTLDVWHYNKADMAEFARTDGGMAPEVEVQFHASGSKFLGY